MAAESEAELTATKAQRNEAEQVRRGRVVQRLIEEYKLSHDGLSPALIAGLELPPLDWLNPRLFEVGETWWIFEIHPNGYDYSMAEIEKND